MVKTEIQTLNYYNGIARGYKNLYHEEQIEKINLIKQFLPDKGIILDLGSGDGVLNQFLSNKKVNIISFDLSFNLLKLNPNKKGNKICGSILNLPFKSNSIDFICSFTVFQDLPDIAKGIFEIKRVLKFDGVIILSFLKLAKDLKLLEIEINTNFNILKVVETEKDFIYVLNLK